MIQSFEINNLGIFDHLSVDWKSRLNVIAGDNGLGKSFLLDVAWLALTRSYANGRLLPADSSSAGTSQAWVNGQMVSYRSSPSQSVSTLEPSEHLVLYVRADGAIAVFDPVRNTSMDANSRPDAYYFSGSTLLDGLDFNGKRVCEGLERDWVSWQKGSELQFDALVQALIKLSPPGELIKPGAPKRINLGDGRDRPMIEVAGQTVPVALASSGIKRIVSLAYTLVWALHEYHVSAELVGRAPDAPLVVLFDEPETHLHPKWQRAIIPSLLEATQVALGTNSSAQFFIATHSPLVLASLEPHFDAQTDGLYHLDLVEGRAHLTEETWLRHGDATNWLVSEIFGLQQARSREAEAAIEAAEALMRGAPTPGELSTYDAIHKALLKTLPDVDPFWPRWIIRKERLAK